MPTKREKIIKVWFSKDEIIHLDRARALAGGQNRAVFLRNTAIGASAIDRYRNTEIATGLGRIAMAINQLAPISSDDMKELKQEFRVLFDLLADQEGD